MNQPTLEPSDPKTTQLQLLGARIRAHRKALRVSSTATAEAAGISRVTLHRIEKGEPSVTVGAWAGVLAVLGLALDTRAQDAPAGPRDTHGASADWIPTRVRLADYPQLQALAWQVHGTDTLTPMEALDIYERNARHLDTHTLTVAEAALLQALRTGLGHWSAGGNDRV
jgi:transcriptional regulator with XRE-family HTH domain